MQSCAKAASNNRRENSRGKRARWSRRCAKNSRQVAHPCLLWLHLGRSDAGGREPGGTGCLLRAGPAPAARHPACSHPSTRCCIYGPVVQCVGSRFCANWHRHWPLQAQSVDASGEQHNAHIEQCVCGRLQPPHARAARARGGVCVRARLLAYLQRCRNL